MGGGDLVAIQGPFRLILTNLPHVFVEFEKKLASFDYEEHGKDLVG